MRSLPALEACRLVLSNRRGCRRCRALLRAGVLLVSRRPASPPPYPPNLTRNPSPASPRAPVHPCACAWCATGRRPTDLVGRRFDWPLTAGLHAGRMRPPCKSIRELCTCRGWRASWPAVHLSGRARRAAALLARRFARTGRPDRGGTSPCGGSNDPVPEKAVGATVVDRSIDLYSHRAEERALHGRYTFGRRCECTVQLSYLRFR